MWGRRDVRIGAFALLVVGVLAARGGLPPYDDAFFFVRFARNLIAHGAPAWNVADGPVYGNTSQLFQLVVALLHAIAPDHTIAATRALLAACVVGTVAALRGSTPALVLAASPVALATIVSGMETAVVLLGGALFLAEVARARDAAPASALTDLRLAFVGAALYLARPDMGLLVVATLAVYRRWRALIATGCGIAVLVAALAALYGTPVPLSFFTKSGWGGLYDDHFVALSRTSKLRHLILFAWVAAPWLRWHPLSIPAGAFVAYHIAGSVDVMGLHARFYAPVLPWIAWAAADRWRDGAPRPVAPTAAFLALWSAAGALCVAAGYAPGNTGWPIGRIAPATYAAYAIAVIIAHARASSLPPPTPIPIPHLPHPLSSLRTDRRPHRRRRGDPRLGPEAPRSPPARRRLRRAPPGHGHELPRSRSPRPLPRHRHPRDCTRRSGVPGMVLREGRVTDLGGLMSAELVNRRRDGRGHLPPGPAPRHLPAPPQLPVPQPRHAAGRVPAGLPPRRAARELAAVRPQRSDRRLPLPVIAAPARYIVRVVGRRWGVWFALLGCVEPTDPVWLDAHVEDLATAHRFGLSAPSGDWARVTCTLSDDPGEVHEVEGRSDEPLTVYGLLADATYRCDLASGGRHDLAIHRHARAAAGPACLRRRGDDRGLHAAQPRHRRSRRSPAQAADRRPRGADPVVLRPRLGRDRSRRAVPRRRAHPDRGGATRSPPPSSGSTAALEAAAGPPAGGGVYHHHVEQLADGTVAALAQTTHEGGGNAWDGFDVEILSPDLDRIVWSWSSQRGIDDGWLPTPARGSDPYHANALVVTDDAVVVSLKHLDQLAKIDRATGSLVWRLGIGADFALLADDGSEAPDEGWFYRHHAPKIRDDRLLVYDNGAGRPGGIEESRALELVLDEAARTATERWRFTEPGWYEQIWGDVDWLPSGHVLITRAHCEVCGAPPGSRTQVLEVDPATNEVVWRITMSDPSDASYRADRIGACEIFSRTDCAP